ncbi:MAG TPA: hypothetical protein VEA60_07570 [Allosphingosinicella sp.]|nr:hypothetical protein [Allosphingosinicella sp.]
MRFFLFLLLMSLGACTQQPEEQAAQSQAATPKEEFYAKYPFRYVEGLNSRVGPAPFGDATEVAEAAIRYNEHPCPRVTKANRNEIDGSVTARCSNGERYVIFKVEAIEQPIALKCSALKRVMNMRLKTCEAV